MRLVDDDSAKPITVDLVLTPDFGLWDRFGLQRARVSGLALQR
ncbi:hypothetical protein [Streptomyces sclerotialus]